MKNKMRVPLTFANLVALLPYIIALKVHSESITLTTSYPSPSGIYQKLTTTQQTILARDGGNVGIGTTGPGSRFVLRHGTRGGLSMDTGRDAFPNISALLGFNRDGWTGAIYNPNYAAYQFTEKNGELDLEVYPTAGAMRRAMKINDLGNIAIERLSIPDTGWLTTGSLEVRGNANISKIGPTGAHLDIYGSVHIVGPGRPLRVMDSDLEARKNLLIYGDLLGTNWLLNVHGDLTLRAGPGHPGNISTPNGRITARELIITGAPKQFRIDHPTDPKHKYLSHAAIEGPEAGVYYRGQGQLINGRVTIKLPHYFEALTRRENRTILLTPKFDSKAAKQRLSYLAASDVEDGQFTVRAMDDNNPFQKFYWEVKAIRADVPHLKVETDKKLQLSSAH